eukprot:4496151-Prymnesium_polylepis.1
MTRSAKALCGSPARASTGSAQMPVRQPRTCNQATRQSGNQAIRHPQQAISNQQSAIRRSTERVEGEGFNCAVVYFS